MAHFKKPAPGQDLSLTDVAAALEEDKDASIAGELDFGLDGDPDLRTRPGQASLLRPKRKSRIVPALVVLALVAAAGAWVIGALDRFGVPPPPRGVSDLLGNAGKGEAVPPPAPAPAPRKRHR